MVSYNSNQVHAVQVVTQKKKRNSSLKNYKNTCYFSLFIIVTSIFIDHYDSNYLKRERLTNTAPDLNELSWKFHFLYLLGEKEGKGCLKILGSKLGFDFINDLFLYMESLSQYFIRNRWLGTKERHRSNNRTR